VYFGKGRLFRFARVHPGIHQGETNLARITVIHMNPHLIGANAVFDKLAISRGKSHVSLDGNYLQWRNFLHGAAQAGEAQIAHEVDMVPWGDNPVGQSALLISFLLQQGFAKFEGKRASGFGHAVAQNDHHTPPGPR
jgi:hypothetical protein